MIGLPDIPHDNFYKFLAFSGLALLLAVNVLYFSFGYDVNARVIEIETQFENYKDHDDAWQKRVDRIDTIFPSGGVESTNSNRTAKIEELDIAHQSLKSEENQMKSRLRDVELRAQDYYLLRWLNFFCSIAGIFLMIVGSRLWYIRVQKPSDDLLSLKLQELRSKQTLSERV